MKEAFHFAHNKILAEYPNLTSVIFEGNEFHLDLVRGLSMYKNPTQGALLQDFGTTATVIALKTKSGNSDEIPRDSDEDIFDEVVIAFVGDSPVSIGRETGKKIVPVENFFHVHSSENPAEEKRIKTFGVTISSGLYIAPPPESGFSFAQLAVTRALGHRYFSNYGVTYEPEIADFVLQSSDRYLVVSSDGVSDVLSPDVIFDTVQKTNSSLHEVAVKLVNLSLTTWSSQNSNPQSKSDLPDNTTAIVVDLKRRSKSKN